MFKIIFEWLGNLQESLYLSLNYKIIPIVLWARNKLEYSEKSPVNFIQIKFPHSGVKQLSQVG